MLASAQPVAQDPCGLSLLPGPVARFLSEKYPQWKAWNFPQGDLDYQPDYLEDWIKNHSKECPGIAVGHFEEKSHLSYAILLVPDDPKRSGYRLVVLSDQQRALREAVIWEGTEPADKVVYGYAHRVPSGDYRDFTKTKSINLTLDGFVFHLIIGKQTILFYWKDGRYRELTIGE